MIKIQTPRRSLTATLSYCYTVLLLYFCTIPPLHAQTFDSLITELSGSEADQLESEQADQKGNNKNSATFSSSETRSSLEEDEFTPQKNIKTNGVVLQGLDKTSARVFITEARIGQVVEFGTLRIVVQHCEKGPPESRQESAAFVKIAEVKPKCTHKLCPVQTVFSGWMFSSSPSLSYFDHPMYDIWIKECKIIK